MINNNHNRSTSQRNLNNNRHTVCNECVVPQSNVPMLDLDKDKFDLPPTYEQVMNIGKKT